MRGSVYYQSSQLVKQIFQVGVKKEDKVNPNHEHYQFVSSYKTMESYRAIWNNFFNYLLEHWKLKNFEKIENHHIQSYMDYKVEYYPSKQYFSRFLLIEILKNPLQKIAAKVQYEGGARIEGVALIKKEQLFGIQIDSISKTTKKSIFTKEKGGKEGVVLISIETYSELEIYIAKNEKFKINRQKYYNDIKQAAIASNEVPEASHGLRWNFAKRRMFEYAKAGYSYDECLQAVSIEMKHNRASITQHYLA